MEPKLGEFYADDHGRVCLCVRVALMEIKDIGIGFLWFSQDAQEHTVSSKFPYTRLATHTEIVKFMRQIHTC